MYNRYIPRSDGSYERSRVAEPAPTVQEAPPPAYEPEPMGPCEETNDHREPVGSFLRRLLPKGFDTGDLIVVLLLLLMAADSPEDQNWALLTLALYLFL